MSQATDEIYKALGRPFPEKAISWRVGATSADKTQGIALAYIDARDVMQRLDDVFGLNWQCKYSHADKKTVCDLGVLIDGEWIWRANGAGDSDVEAEKGAISDAFKRAAVMFGIGRYLYSLPNSWVPIKAHGKSYALVTPPKLPKWATPEGYDEGNVLADLAGIVQGFMQAGEIELASNAIRGAGMGAEEHTDMRGMLDSSERSAIKAFDAIKEAKTLDALKLAWDAAPKHAHKMLTPYKDKRKAALTGIAGMKEAIKPDDHNAWVDMGGTMNDVLGE